MPTSTDDVVFHFPPDFLSAVVDAIPLLTRGRNEVVTFFQGCGVSREFLKGISARIAADPKYSKYHATREILTHLNEIGDQGLAARRQVIQRVSQWEDFSTCYPDNQMKARGAVATVAQLVNQKDSFTRMNIERERAQEQHRKDREAELAELQQRRGELASVKDDLSSSSTPSRTHSAAARRSRASSTGSSRPRVSPSRRPSRSATRRKATASSSRSTAPSSCGTSCTSSR